ncbi:MAG: G-D-S-L family lipolytic protein [Flavisolibacter sp.]|nr:G-D-S-L family lipolytic protein [Flavisolibacter sp.]
MHKKFLYKSLLLWLLLTTSTGLFAQQLPFWDEITAFKEQDSISFPPRNVILFTGSSSFRMWKDVQDYFPGHTIINRAFGGSTLPDVIRYASDIILPYHPRQVVIYCGDNDLASSDTVTAQTVVQRFQQLFSIIRQGLPKASIAYVSIKPSPSRINLMPKMEEANEGIKRFLKKKKRTAFIDVYHPMLTPAGEPMEDLFLEDKLHMNAKGYAIWQKAILPYLRK